jgi:hypothetical protein
MSVQTCLPACLPEEASERAKHTDFFSFPLPTPLPNINIDINITHHHQAHQRPKTRPLTKRRKQHQSRNEGNGEQWRARSGGFQDWFLFPILFL